MNRPQPHPVAADPALVSLASKAKLSVAELGVVARGQLAANLLVATAKCLALELKKVQTKLNQARGGEHLPSGEVADASKLWQ